MTKLEEAIIINWLGENVSKLLLSQDILQLDIS
jgi:hypothetical protein